MAKTLIGTVVSDKSDKTISVKVVSHQTHPIYKKQYIESKRFKAHDANNEAKVGDKVSITESKPISADKYFRLEKIIERPLITEKDVVSEESVVEKIDAPDKKSEAKKPTASKQPKKETK